MTEGRFAGRVAMITGAAGGFGAVAARRFGAEGAALLLSDADGAGLAALAEALRETGVDCLAEAFDITNEASVAAHVERGEAALGPLDIGVNNAGVGQPLAPLPKLSAEDFDRVMAVNARAVFLCMKHQLPGMVARRSGAILNMASAAGLVGAGQLSAYAASKHAVVGLTRSAADEVARKGVRVNALCPSFAPTALFDAMADEIGARHGLARQEAYDRIAARIPMRRVAEIDEVVQAMLWACDPANSFMTGQAIAIDGGLTAI